MGAYRRHDRVIRPDELIIKKNSPPDPAPQRKGTLVRGKLWRIEYECGCTQGPVHYKDIQKKCPEHGEKIESKYRVWEEDEGKHI